MLQEAGHLQIQVLYIRVIKKFCSNVTSLTTALTSPIRLSAELKLGPWSNPWAQKWYGYRASRITAPTLAIQNQTNHPRVWWSIFATHIITRCIQMQWNTARRTKETPLQATKVCLWNDTTVWNSKTQAFNIEEVRLIWCHTRHACEVFLLRQGPRRGQVPIEC